MSLERDAVGVHPGKVRSVKPRDLAVRFGFGAGVSVLAGVLKLAFGARFGGMFLAFPAILPAALTLLQRQEGHGASEHDARGAGVGAAGMVAFALVAAALFGRVQSALALGAATLAWVVVSLVLWRVLRRRLAADAAG